MNTIKTLLLILLSCTNINLYAFNSGNIAPSDKLTRSDNLLVQESALCIKKHAWIIALTPVLTYYHQDIMNMVSHQPCISALTIYLILHYLCDTILHYQEQESILKSITLVKKIALHLVVSHGIKNYVRHNITPDDFRHIDDLTFCKMITADLPCSLHELTLLVTTSYRQLKTSLQTINENLNIESEEFVFLCYAPSITLEDLLYLAQKESDLYTKIYQFQKQPHAQLQSVLEYLKSEIAKDFKTLQSLTCLSNAQQHI